MNDDLLKDENNDLQLSANGDLLIGDATVQMQRDVIELDKGYHKYRPQAGAASGRWLNGNDALAGEVKAALSAEGLPANIATDGNIITVLTNAPQ